MTRKKRLLSLVILSIIAGLQYLTPLLRFSFYDQMCGALNLTDVQLGSIGAAYGIFNIIGYVPSGFLAERFKAKTLVLISIVGMFAVTLWYATFPGFAALWIIHALYGVFSVGIFWSAYLKAIRQLGSEEEQSRMFGISEALRGIAQTLVAFFCLFLMGRFASYVMGFRALLLVNAVMFALLFLAMLLFVPDLSQFQENSPRENSPKEENPQGQKPHSFFSIIKMPAVWLCIGVILCGYTLWNTANGYIGTYCTRILHLSDSLSSAISILRTYIIVFTAGISGGFMIDRFKKRGIGMFCMYAGCLVTLVGILCTRHIIFLCVGITVILSYFINVIKSTYWSIMGDAGIPRAATGLATGVISFIALTPDMFVSPVISRFIQWGERIGRIEAGFHAMFIWLLVWSLLGMGASLLLVRFGRKTS